MIRHACLLLIVSVLLMGQVSWSRSREFPITPASNDGKPWRIALYQGGPLRSYQDSLYYMAEALAQMGWIADTEIPRPTEPSDTWTLWEWLSEHASNEFLDFRADAFYSAGWDPEFRMRNQRALIQRLDQFDDIDLIIAMGTWAGQDLANQGHATPTMVISVSDALASGIVESVEDSGMDHLHAFLNPGRYLLQVQLFHSIMEFQHLGVVYEDTLEGRSYAAMDNIREVAAERGFAVVSCEAPFSGVTDQQAAENVLACHQRLTPQVDAMYITVHRGVTVDNIGELLVPLFEYDTPTFAQPTSEYVARGVLFSISRANWRFESAFYARTLAKILNGALPRELPQVFEAPPKIAINLATAERIGYEPPIAVLGLADEIYMEIEEQTTADELASR